MLRPLRQKRRAHRVARWPGPALFGGRKEREGGVFIDSRQWAQTNYNPTHKPQQRCPAFCSQQSPFRTQPHIVRIYQGVEERMWSNLINMVLKHSFVSSDHFLRSKKKEKVFIIFIQIKIQSHVRGSNSAPFKTTGFQLNKAPYSHHHCILSVKFFRCPNYWFLHANADWFSWEESHCRERNVFQGVAYF